MSFVVTYFPYFHIAKYSSKYRCNLPFGTYGSRGTHRTHGTHEIFIIFSKYTCKLL